MLAPKCKKPKTPNAMPIPWGWTWDYHKQRRESFVFPTLILPFSESSLPCNTIKHTFSRT